MASISIMSKFVEFFASNFCVVLVIIYLYILKCFFFIESENKESHGNFILVGMGFLGRFGNAGEIPSSCVVSSKHFVVFIKAIKLVIKWAIKLILIFIDHIYPMIYASNLHFHCSFLFQPLKGKNKKEKKRKNVHAPFAQSESKAV